MISPSRWSDNDGRLIGNIDKFLELSKEKQLSEIEKILNKNVSEKDVVLAGAVVDYTYKKKYLVLF